MMPHPYTIEYFEPVGVAEKKMSEHKIRHLPVVDRKKVYGIISDRDIKLAASVYREKDYHLKVLVKEICLSSPYVVDESELLATVLETMAKRRLGSAIVTSSGVVTGIFTTTDACRLLALLAKQGLVKP